MLFVTVASNAIEFSCESWIYPFVATFSPHSAAGDAHFEVLVRAADGRLGPGRGGGRRRRGGRRVLPAADAGRLRRLAVVHAPRVAPAVGHVSLGAVAEHLRSGPMLASRCLR